VHRPLALIFALVSAALVVPNAFGSGATTTTSAVDLQPRGQGRFVAGRAVPDFTLAGVSWRGTGTVEFRTRSVRGRWSAWHRAGPEAEDSPDVGSPEQRRRRGWRLGNPWWSGASDLIEARSSGDVSTVRAHLVWSPATNVPIRIPAATVAPAIVPRSEWGANESIRRGPPTYAPEVKFAIVHHTAGRNDYTRAQAAAIVRGIQLFHVRSNGWNDIGYNFLVDRFGTIYEGRYGGVDRNVVGAHALGFNTGSVGIALLGTYGDTTPSAAAQDAIARLIAWRLDLAHVDPASTLTFISGGSEKYAPDAPVTLRAVSGHRDTGSTECPGNALYARLGAIASSSRAIGGPKIFEPRTSSAGSATRFRALVSQSQPWTVTVTTAAGGVQVAQGSGAGTAVDWTWDSAGVPVGSYRWTIAAGAARPATGILRAGGSTAALAIESAAALPDAISPNGDGQADAATVTYRITAAANVTVEVTDGLGGVVATVVDRVWMQAGEHTVSVDGAPLVDGEYSVVISARTAGGLSVQSIVPLHVNRTLGLVTTAPAAFSPNGDGRKDRLTLTFTLGAPADVVVRIERDGRWVATPLTGVFDAGTQRLVWDGSRVGGMLRDGEYSAVVEATNELGVISYGVPFVSDTVAPRVRFLPGKRVALEVSEPSVLTLVIDGRALRREVSKAGTVRIAGAGTAMRVRVVAWDVAGNASGPVLRVRRE
jgi:N-acetylmuramoyl-L-alanine amidase